jgi:hypothetical protein
MTRRDRLMILTVLGVALLVGFWMFVLSPQREAAAGAKAQVETARTALAAAQAKVTSGKAAQAAFRRDRATIVKIGRAVPETDDIPTLITQLETLAKKHKVYFVKYVVATGGEGGGAAASTPSASSSASSSSTTTQPGAEKANSSTEAVAPLYPPGSVQMTGGLGRTPVTLGLKGTYFNLEKYLRAVQRFAVLSQNNERAKGRLLIVDGFSYTSGDLVFRDLGSKKSGTERWLDAELSASVYFAPPLEAPSASTAAAPAASAATPAAGTAPAPSTGTATVGGLR